jgi:hypothetical protein
MNANKPLPGRRAANGTATSVAWTASFAALLVLVVALPVVLTTTFGVPVEEAVRQTVVGAGVGYGGWLAALFR